MTIEMKEYLDNIVNSINSKTNDVTAYISTKITNNGVEHYGVVVRQKEGNISPCVYVNQLYDKGVPYNEAVDVILQKSDEIKKRFWDVDIIQDWEYVKSRIHAKLVNFELNKDSFTDQPYRKFLDLAIVYYIEVDPPINEGYLNTISVDDRLLSHWCKNEDDLYTETIKNMEKENSTILAEMKSPFLTDVAPPIFILSNYTFSFGASEILNPQTLRAIHAKLGKFIILPSSINEVMIVPDDGRLDYDFYKNLVKDINQDQNLILYHDVLSNNIYVYDGEITIKKTQ